MERAHQHPYPNQQVVVQPKSQNSYAFGLFLEAMQSLQDVQLGQKCTSQSWLQPGNFILGFKMTQDTDLISDVSWKQLGVTLNFSSRPSYPIVLSPALLNGSGIQQITQLNPITMDVWVVSDRTLLSSKSRAKVI